MLARPAQDLTYDRVDAADSLPSWMRRSDCIRTNSGCGCCIVQCGHEDYRAMASWRRSGIQLKRSVNSPET